MTPLHVAITMDGNGRWAELRGLSRTEGHRRGATAVRRIVEAAPESGITTLTLYAFSANNWRRPKPEVLALMTIFDQYLHDVGPVGLGQADRRQTFANADTAQGSGSSSLSGLR